MPSRIRKDTSNGEENETHIEMVDEHDPFADGEEVVTDDYFDQPIRMLELLENLNLRSQALDMTEEHVRQLDPLITPRNLVAAIEKKRHPPTLDLAIPFPPLDPRCGWLSYPDLVIEYADTSLDSLLRIEEGMIIAMLPTYRCVIEGAPTVLVWSGHLLQLDAWLLKRQRQQQKKRKVK